MMVTVAIPFTVAKLQKTESGLGSSRSWKKESMCSKKGIQPLPRKQDTRCNVSGSAAIFLLKCEENTGKTLVRLHKTRKDGHLHAYMSGVEMTSLQKLYGSSSMSEKYPAFTSLWNRAGSFSEDPAEEGWGFSLWDGWAAGRLSCRRPPFPLHPSGPLQCLRSCCCRQRGWGSGWQRLLCLGRLWSPSGACVGVCACIEAGFLAPRQLWLLFLGWWSF